MRNCLHSIEKILTKKLRRRHTETSCHVIGHVLFVVVSIAPLCIERNHDFLHIFSKNFYIHFSYRRKIPLCLCNSPEIEIKIGMSIKCIQYRVKNTENIDWMATYIAFGMQFHQKTFSFEGNFPDFSPRECVDTCDALKHSNTHMRYGQIKWNTFNVFGWMHSHAIQFATSRCF